MQQYETALANYDRAIDNSSCPSDNPALAWQLIYLRCKDTLLDLIECIPKAHQLDPLPADDRPGSMLPAHQDQFEADLATVTPHLDQVTRANGFINLSAVARILGLPTGESSWRHVQNVGKALQNSAERGRRAA